MTVVALIPALNEASRVGKTVRAVSSISAVDRTVVIDDGSTDGTASAAESAGADVMTLGANVGKGAALDAGLSFLDAKPDVLLLLDADLGPTASEAASLLAPVMSGDANVAIANFPKTGNKTGFGLVKGLARWGIARLGGDFEADAPLSGQRAIDKTALDAVTPFAFGYGVDVAVTIRALRAGLRVVEVPTTMSHSVTGRNLHGFVHRGRQFVDVLLTLVRLRKEALAKPVAPDSGTI